VAPRPGLGEAGGMTPEPVSYHRHRFPAAIIRAFSLRLSVS
jgi:hypothetical protein